MNSIGTIPKFSQAADEASQSDIDTPFLEVRGIHKRFGGVHALRGVDLCINPGQIYHLMGENGCGKSTLIKIISGAQPADEGEIRINGEPVTSLDPLGALRAGIETVYQDLSLLPNLSVTENIALSEQLVAADGKLARSLDLGKLTETATRALKSVNLPTDKRFCSTEVAKLPIATRQLVAIARAIASDARLVIMDEPTAALTKREVDNLIEIVDQLRSRGVAVLFVTHKLDEVMSIGGHFIIMRDGEKVQEGDVADYQKTDLSFWMTGRKIDVVRYRTTEIGAENLLVVEGLKRRNAFADVSFSLAHGEIVGVTGLLDSGRNELARALAGVEPADGGSIVLDGKSLHLRRPVDAINEQIGYVPEDRLSEGLFLAKPIQSNIVAQILDDLRDKFGMISKIRSRKMAERLVKDLQIVVADLNNPVQSLSGGNQQRVLIGRGLTIAPKVFVLHGPTVGVDVGSKDTIFRIIQKLSSQGMGVIIVSDDLPELLQNCDRIIVMRRGRIVETFNAENLEENTLYQAMVAENSTGKQS
ncbi:sugar ABC transporter ATP-binding protein [Cohaesibacter haloalkalitolerans]|uniref:sugar ABC transporter ATP-binding protein n=1 Tax=Cohaesibacter haloalkalitolerans TaxID=1162980 RepID=UPI000E64B9A5|nr:sugar ABC transporter ATP-binding protein [Cohaesibacter haloalkalitolerans]